MAKKRKRPILRFKHAGAVGELEACSWLLRCGYEVFRNVSQCGSVDLVGIREGKTYLFDVKYSSYKNPRERLTPEQIRCGIKTIYVYSSGACVVDWSPGTPIKRTFDCIGCGKPAIQIGNNRGGKSRKYCPAECREKNRRKPKTIRR